MLSEKQKQMLNETFIFNEEGVIAIALIVSAIVGVSEYRKRKQRKKAEKDKKKKEEDDEKEAQESEGKKMSDKYNLEHFDDLQKFLISETKKLISKMKSSPDFKKKIKQSVDEYKKEFPDDSDYYEIKCDIFEDTRDSLILEIVDGEQDMRIQLHWILKVLEESLEIKYSPILEYHRTYIDTGDGDEGCLYFSCHKPR